MPWRLPETRAEKLALATGYPYEAPAESYLFRDGRVLPIARADFDERVPVIAHGSNRAPEQLHRKYGHLPGEGSEIPVTFGWLKDYDVVYASHVTRYGAVASTLHHMTGCRVRVAVNWLNAAQLERMHETEGVHYAYGALKDIEFEMEAGPDGKVPQAWLYLARFGTLAKDGEPVGLAALEADGRSHPALAQKEAQELLRDRHRPDEDLEEFILANFGTSNNPRRLRLIEEIRETARPMTAPHFHLEIEKAPGPE
ncbi:MAG: hypothetical protein R3316_00325 [Rhodovibrionaceae bacterium]|nr:hypothetical protein [Rhodovibrionaceae bacterium]